jgi:hypothetical protein
MAEEQQQQTTPPAKVEIELDDKGNPVGEVPDPLKRLLDRKVNDAVQTALKNAEKKGLTPAEREELAAVKQKLSLAEQAAAEHNQQWKEALRIQEERLEAKRAADLAAEKEAVKARDARIARYQQQTALGAIRTAAVAAGARDESLADLEELLGSKVAFDHETDAPYVAGTDGTKQTVEQFVTAYLQARPHFLGRPKGTPGRATGGMSLGGRTLNTADAQRDAAFQRLSEAPTLGNVAGAVGAIRARKAS